MADTTNIALTPDEIEFVEYMGLTAQSDGQARILGRIWALLMLREGPMDAEDMAELLQVSRGSISTNLRTLLTMNVISRKSKPGERKDYFALKDNPYLSLLEAQVNKLGDQIEHVEMARAKVTNTHAKMRLKNLATFYSRMREGYVAGLKKYGDK